MTVRPPTTLLRRLRGPGLVATAAAVTLCVAGGAGASVRPQTTTATAATTTTASTATAAAPVTVGLLGPSYDQASALVGSRVTVLGLGTAWSAVEPQQGVYDSSVLSALANQISVAHSYGFRVVLDLGLQYPPAWVFSLPGQTRFVDQYGDVWHGASSEDVPNAVFDPAVRAAEGDYLAHLAQALPTSLIGSVRVGGLLSGELRYPVAAGNGHTDLLWDYDPAAQAQAPVPGWRPGTGTADQARASLQYYFDSLTGYEVWQLRAIAADFGAVDQQVLLPSWGIRPGEVDAAIAGGFHDTTLAEVGGMISAGLDWANQVKAISDNHIHGTVYTTWLDAPSQGSTVQQIPPVDYLASLAATYGLPVAGENTGGGGTNALILCAQRAQADHLTSMMYFSGPKIADGSAGISLANLAQAGAYLNP